MYAAAHHLPATWHDVICGVHQAEEDSIYVAAFARLHLLHTAHLHKSISTARRLTMSAVAATTTTRYKSPIPPSVKIAVTKPELGRLQEANLGCLLYPENGGYYLKHPEGAIIAIASDRLCSVLDDSYLSLLFHFERDGLQKEAQEVVDDLRKGGMDVARLKADASDEVRSAACVWDGGREETRPATSGDDCKPKTGSE